MGNEDNITEKAVVAEEKDANVNTETAVAEQEPKKDNKKRNIIILSVIAAIIIVVISIFSYWWITNHKLVESYDNKVYPECYINEEPVGELSASELSETIKNLENQVRDKNIKVSVNGKEYDTQYWNMDVTINADELEDEAMNYGKDKAFNKKLDLIKNPEKTNFDVKVSWDDSKIDEFVQQIADENKTESVNASAEVVGGAVNVTDGAVGYEIDKDALVEAIKSQITAKNGGQDIALEAEIKEVQPSITSEALRSIDTKISSFTTYFSAGPSGNNIQTGAGYVNNTLVMPGEEFSCTDAIGPTTYDRGFGDANTYVSGQVVKGVGGGVCQIATTVYNAELRAGLIPTERQNHMMTVGYIGIGLDATLADNLIDLKFENTFDYPLIVAASSTSTSLTVEVWSNSQATGGCTYEPRVIASDSLHCVTYLDVYDAAGNLINSIYLNESNYQPFS